MVVAGVGVGVTDTTGVELATQKRTSPLPANAFVSATDVEIGGTLVAVETSVNGIAFAAVSAAEATTPKPRADAAPTAIHPVLFMTPRFAGLDETTGKLA